MIPRSDVIEYARTLIGVPYRHMGRNGLGGRPGLDCAGPLVCICHRFGIPHRDHFGTYSEYPSGGKLERFLSRSLVPIGADQIRPASVIVSRVWGPWGQSGEIAQHMAIVVAVEPRLRILHAADDDSIRRVAEHDARPQHAENILCAFDFPGVG